MPDIAEIARRSHDTGFEQGSVAACNAIIAFLDRSGHAAIATEVMIAWEAGSIAEPAQSASPAAAMQSPPKITREQARSSGYTGDVCTSCQSLQVKRNGSCLVCEGCGQTTGCS